ncbi:ABC transporter substrate-binding protein [Streptomyces sulphureus]|uniref:ABC transporter substrate-binding protein n=1 Tax=Streptomyces sulphureus TaxID=47758 RepID=UPI00035C47C6|nr:ABC transporter substrate-binding protein [Streptomyces sulphureus]
MARPRPASQLRPFGVLFGCLLLLTACGADAGSGDEKGARPAGFPYTVTNCGVRTTYEEPPQRAVAMNQHATEVLLALGLGDRMVGTAFLDDEILPEYAAEYRKIDVLAKQYPSREALLGANPDFVYGGYESAFEKSEGRDRSTLGESGINTRLNIESCTKGRVGPDELERELRETARVFGVPKRAERLIERQHEQLDAVAERLDGVDRTDVFVYDSGEGSAFTAGGGGIGVELIERAGGRNVFADVGKPFADVSWEKVVERQPETVLLYDYAGTPLTEKRKRLLDDSALQDVPAVRDREFAVLPLSSAVLGVRMPQAVEDLARQLHPERFPKSGDKAGR